MKLFIWNNPYRVNYGCSMVFAVAETLEQAKLVAADTESTKGYTYGEYANGFGGKSGLGEPTRTLEVPCAEWHEWAE